MNSIAVLDVTLRDGGCVNDFNFGQEYMDKILSSLEQSGVDYIELGYLDEKKGSSQGRTQYCNEKVIPEFLLKRKKRGITYVAMMDYGKFNVDNLEMRTGDGIDGIRLAFHKKNWPEALAIGKKIIKKGYQLYIQPMLTLWYSDMELLELIYTVNDDLPDASGFYIVDSFGEMRGNDIVRLLHLVDKNLIPSMILGFHSHNNLQLSYSNAMTMLQFPGNRSCMLDSSVMGMGKGAGNLNTELLLEHLNLYYGKRYRIDSLLKLIDEVISVIHKETYWGYSVEYYLSSMNHCTPSYAKHFYNKHMLTIDQVAELLSMIDDDKKKSFDKEYAERLYLEFNSQKGYDDETILKEMTSVFKGKTVIVIAPGKGIAGSENEIDNLLKNPDIISVGLNNDIFKTDYVLVTRTDMCKKLEQSGAKVIVPSNVASHMKTNSEAVKMIDYKRWIINADGVYDSSGVLILRLLEYMNAKKVLLAGFDGFSINVNENYFDPAMRKPITEEHALQSNHFYRNFIQEMKKKLNISFLTKSGYER